MNKVSVKVVIGANYGDEGKGLVTNYLSRDCGKCLNVLYNGGPQRGHTVQTKENGRHVFHHFGSGTFSGADTYFDENFLINPMCYVEEKNDLSYKFRINPKCFISPNVKVTTPYDMIINQIIETSRGESRHGSCGFGIWETQVRYQKGFGMSFANMSKMTNKSLRIYLEEIQNDYLCERLSEYGIIEIPSKYENIIKNGNALIEHYIDDFRKMQSKSETIDFKELVSDYDTVVFEGGQGLALDEKNIEMWPNVTASDTTSRVPILRTKGISCDVEIFYVTRSYFTRHGAGKFPSECSKDLINPEIQDYTNIDNDFQGSIRYGRFDKKEFLNRVMEDLSFAKRNNGTVKSSLFVTHLNYTNGDLYGADLKDIEKYFDRVEYSYSTIS